MNKIILRTLLDNCKVISKSVLIVAALSQFTAQAQCPTPPGNQTTYGTTEWIGYVYTDYTIANPPPDPFSGTYRGYITAPDNSFDLSMGNDPVAGANLCGTYADNFAIRFKLSKDLSPGFYQFNVGGDDGYRVSLDGGDTFNSSLSAWSDHGYVPSTLNYYHSGGVLNLVLEYYEAGGGASINFNYHLMDCTSTPPTGITGNTFVSSCAPSTTLTATGGNLGVGSHYQWGTGNVIGENPIPGAEGVTLNITPATTTTYWVRRYAAYECAGPTSGVSTVVTVAAGAPGNPDTDYGSGTWNVYTYQGSNPIMSYNTYKGYYTDSNLSYNSEASFNQSNQNPSNAATWQGCPFAGADNFIFIAKRQGFDCGEYTISANKWDDEIWVYIDNETTPVFHYNGWSGGAPTVPYPLGNITLNANSKIIVKVIEGGGDASGYVKIVPAWVAPTAITGSNETCAGQATTLTATGGTAGTTGTYQWGTGTPGSNIIAGQTGSTISVQPAEDTTYWAKIVFPGCTNTTAVTKTITIGTNTWTGATNTSWNTPGNWSCNSVPTASAAVAIPATANQPTITGITAHAKSLIVNSGAQVTVATGATLQVVNAINTYGQLTVNNDAALIQDNIATNNGAITVVKNSNPLYRLDYTMWSSPVSGQNIFDFSPLTNTTRFYEYKYDENPLSETGEYIEQYFGIDNVANATFNAGKGYLIRMPNINVTAGYNAGTTAITYTGSFTGIPNNGTVSTTLSTSGNRYTAVGNPYPSPISVSEFFDQNAGVLDGASPICFWRKKNNAAVSSYATLTKIAYTANVAGNGNINTGYYSGNNSDDSWTIAPGQGFIVRTAQGLSNPQLEFYNSMRKPVATVGGQAFFKSAPAQSSRLWLNLTDSSNGFSQAAIAYTAGGTLGLDYGYDGQQFTDGGNVTLYSLAANTSLAIQARPTFETTDVVPMGFVANVAGQYTIALDHFDGLFTGDQNIYIKDNTEGILHNLKNSDYTFTTAAGNDTTRFEVVYTTDALNTQNPALSANSVMVYKQGTDLNINSGTTQMTDINIFDIRGRKLYSQSNINANQTVVTGLQVQNEVLIIEINTLKGKVNKKIVF